MATTLRSRTLALALLAAAAATLTGCQPKDSAKPDTGSAAVEPSGDKPAPVEPAKPVDAAAAKEPGMKGLDPSPALSRTDMGNGLIIEDLKMGTGDIVWPGARVRLQIKGWSVATGQMYWDTQAQQGAPREVVLSEAMKGMRDGVPGMRVGGKRRLHVPADLAYGFKEVKNEKDEVVVPLGTPIVLEIEVVESLTRLKLDSAPADSAGQPAPR